jgi:hypothetical protein
MDPWHETLTARPAPEAVLRSAAETARRAPSVLPTLPWQWTMQADGLELWADRSRLPSETDPFGRMLTVSCGTALHHATLSLAAGGWRTRVTRFPDGPGSDLLARITVTGGGEPAEADVRLAAAIGQRHTDRRPFGDTPIGETTAQRLRGFAKAHGVYLADLGPEEMVRFEDTGARFLVLWTSGDEPADRLVAGEAMSAVLLETTVLCLAAAPLPDLVEVPAARSMLYRLLGGRGHAHAVLRVGLPGTDMPGGSGPGTAGG